MSSSIIKETFVCYRNDLSVAEREWKIMHENDEIEKDVALFNHPGEKEEEQFIANLKTMPDNLLKYIPNANNEKIDPKLELQKLKQAATLMTNQDVIGALILCTEAITTCRDDNLFYTLLVKRSELLVTLNEFEKSLNDLKKALLLNGVGRIPYFRSVRCYIKLGQVEQAEYFIYQHKDIFDGNQVTAIFRNDIQQVRNVLDDVYENSRNYHKCLEILNKGFELAPACVGFMVFKVKYLVLLNKLEEAKEVDNEINKRCRKTVKVLDAFLNYYDSCNFEKCNFEMIGAILKVNLIDDMMEKAKEFKVNFKFVENKINAKNYEDAVFVLHELYDCDDTNRKAYLKICEMLLECYKNLVNQDDNVVKYATEILKFNPQDVHVLMARAEAFLKIKLLDEAATDLKTLLKFNSGKTNDFSIKCEDLLKYIKKVQKLEEQKKLADERIKEEQEKAKKAQKDRAVNLKKAEAFNENGNRQYKSKFFENATHYYSDAINLCPKVAKYYTNRCSSYMYLALYENAMHDAVKAVDVDPTFWKGYSRAINCFLILGNIKQARFFIDKMQNNIAGIGSMSINYNEIPKVDKLENLHTRIVKFMDEKNYEECLKHLEAALKIATACKQYDFWMAECLIMIGKGNESQQVTAKYPKEPYAVYLNGILAFTNDDYSKSIELFQNALKLDPEFSKASAYKKTVMEIKNLELVARHCFSTSDVRGAITAYTSIIDCKHDNVRLKLKAYISRAELHFNSQSFQRAFEDCSMALRLKSINENEENCIKALILRAKIHCKQQEFEDAVIDCDEILRIVGTVSKHKDEVDVLRKDAKHSSLHRNIRNYYEILRVPRKSPMAVIKEAFKTLSRLYHSDKHPDATAVEKRKLEIRFQEIRTAFECLKIQNEC